MPRLTQNERTEAVEMYRGGATMERTAVRFGCTIQTVDYWVRKAGVPTHRARAKTEAVPRICQKRTTQGYITWTIRYWVDGERRYDYLLEHRVLMEKHLGRPLATNEQVHHRNGRRADNRIENFELRIGAHGSGATHCPHCGLPITGQ